MRSMSLGAGLAVEAAINEQRLEQAARLHGQGQFFQAREEAGALIRALERTETSFDFSQRAIKDASGQKAIRVQGRNGHGKRSWLAMCIAKEE